jgi:hypothetical protein
MVTVKRYNGPRQCACWRPAAFAVDSSRGDATHVLLLCLRCADALSGGLGSVFAEHREGIVRQDVEWVPPPRKE